MDAEVLIIGAGVSGIGAAVELLKGGQRSFLILEGAESLGGTWRDNTYPGISTAIPG
ncbi:MAG: NAD(P)-binding protein [Myxococcota bacterium]